MYWQLAEAKNKFSKLMDLALDKKPQRVRRRDRAVVVMDEKDYDRITGKKKSFIEFLMSGPSFEGLDLTRDKSLMRDIEL